MKAIMLMLALGVAVSAQTYLSPLGLQDFLGLTNTQWDAIAKNNDDYNRAVIEKQNRIQQVQVEIGQYTSAQTIDPMELGVRYMEIEYLCRQMRDAAVAAQNKNLALLNDAQKTKLKVLEDAMNLSPVISQAQSVKLLSGSALPGYSFTSVNTLSGILLGFPSAVPVSGCYKVSVPTLAVRQGAFSPTAP
jgi:hypothetical protein